MVQARELTAIAAAWREKGSPTHVPRTAKEYDLGGQTGDVGCLECGETWNPKTDSHPPQES